MTQISEHCNHIEIKSVLSWQHGNNIEFVGRRENISVYHTGVRDLSVITKGLQLFSVITMSLQTENKQVEKPFNYSDRMYVGFS